MAAGQPRGSREPGEEVDSTVVCGAEGHRCRLECRARGAAALLPKPEPEDGAAAVAVLGPVHCPGCPPGLSDRLRRSRGVPKRSGATACAWEAGRADLEGAASRRLSGRRRGARHLVAETR